MNARIEPVNWSIFRYRLGRDLEEGRDTLLPLTLLLPWWLTAVDLGELGRRHEGRRRVTGSISAALPGLIHEVVSCISNGSHVGRWMAAQMGELFAGSARH